MSKNKSRAVYMAAQKEVTESTQQGLRETAVEHAMEALRKGLNAVIEAHNKHVTDPSRRYKLFMSRDASHGTGFAVYFIDEQPFGASSKKKYQAEAPLPPLIDLRIKQDKDGLTILRLSYDLHDRPQTETPLAVLKNGALPILNEQDHDAILAEIECALITANCSSNLAHRQSVERIKAHDKRHGLS